jgi:hypothetical protein
MLGAPAPYLFFIVLMLLVLLLLLLVVLPLLLLRFSRCCCRYCCFCHKHRHTVSGWREAAGDAGWHSATDGEAKQEGRHSSTADIGDGDLPSVSHRLGQYVATDGANVGAAFGQ